MKNIRSNVSATIIMSVTCKEQNKQKRVVKSKSLHTDVNNWHRPIQNYLHHAGAQWLRVFFFSVFVLLVLFLFCFCLCMNCSETCERL